MNILEASKKAGYRIVPTDDQYRVFSGNQLISIKGLKERVFNEIAGIRSYVEKVNKTEEGYDITVGFESDFLTEDLQENQISVKVDATSLPVEVLEKKTVDGTLKIKFLCHVIIDNIKFMAKTSPFLIEIEDTGSEYKSSVQMSFTKLKSADKLYNKKNFLLYYSDLHFVGSDTVFLVQNGNNKFCITRREHFPTDEPEEQAKIRKAYKLAKIYRFLPKYKGIIFFEKFTEKYEESASIIFEKFVDSGYKNAYFIIDEKSIHYKNIPEKYRKYIVKKYSLMHYILLFTSKVFLATESMNHIIDLNIANGYIRRKIDQTKYRYYFLQHGVMYMYSLKGRKAFQYGGWGFGDNVKIVASSELEKDHFVIDGKFQESQILVTGLPKFDRARRKPGADKIAIMPTSRDFEYNVIRQTPTESTYYHFVKSILDNIPEELKEKVIVLPHPLIKNCFDNTDIAKYIPKQWIYDEVLQEVDTFITDYSSASYDAYYRGCNVIFAWEHREMCLGELGYGLMLNEENAFGDISHEFADISQLLKQNYGTDRRETYKDKYKKIVQFDDNKNTERCFQAIRKDLENKQKVRINKTRTTRFTALDYCGKAARHKRVHLVYKDEYLIEGVDYTPRYIINWRKGANLMLFVGKGRYRGIKPRFFKIKDNIGKLKVNKFEGTLDGELSNYDITYEGRSLKLNKDFILVDVENLEVWKENWKDNPAQGYPDYCKRIIQGQGKLRGKQTVYCKLVK